MEGFNLTIFFFFFFLPILILFSSMDFKHKIIQWNCRGLKPNYNEVSLLISEYNLSVFCFQETFLKPDDNISLEGFSLESPYHLVAVSGAHFTQGTILIVIIVSSGSAKSRTHQSAVGGFLVTRRGWPGRLRACRIWTFINSV